MSEAATAAEPAPAAKDAPARSSTPRASSSALAASGPLTGPRCRCSGGSITALIGPNGAGKTTFFNLITGFYRRRRRAGHLRRHGITGKQPHAIARLGMVRTFQITKALSAMTVLDN